MRPRLVVAALSARMLAESARDAGYDVVALDVFGDRDTRSTAVQWRSIGSALHIDASLLCAALRGVDAQGWVAGAGCEPHLAAACAAAPALALIGNAPEVVAAVRHPQAFFGALREHGIAFPETRLDAAPADCRGWLSKDFAGSGGWHIHAAAPAPRNAAPSPSRPKFREEVQTHYWQRVHAGEPISALLVADGLDARVLGVQRQLVRPVAGRPFVFCGVVGPVAIGDLQRRAINDIATALVARFGLRGLASVDFLLPDDGAPLVLEVNPRPTASIALYDDGRGAMLRAHVAACRDGLLCDAPAADGLRGIEIVFADRDAVIGPGDFPAWCHDLPVPGAPIERGDPVCTVSAAGPTEAALRERLARCRDEVLSSLLETVA